MSCPAKGDITSPQTAPRLTAPENRPRDQPNSSVIGITKTDSTATDATGLAPKLGRLARANTTHP